jgi:Na+/serine symporter
MPTASFSFLPSPISFVGIIANTLVVGYLVHVFHKLTKTVLFSEFTRWNELKRYHVIATVFGIVALIANTLEKAGCTFVNDRDGQYPLECNILVIAIMIPFLIGNILVFFESLVFSYCRLYMILPGIFCFN